jgi:hypothetical protein
MAEMQTTSLPTGQMLIELELRRPDKMLGDALLGEHRLIWRLTRLAFLAAKTRREKEQDNRGRDCRHHPDGEPVMGNAGCR